MGDQMQVALLQTYEFLDLFHDTAVGHESSCLVWAMDEWKGDEPPHCWCNDECARCGSRFWEPALSTGNREDAVGVCGDCWDDVLAN